ncbi:MAG TPA: hypothetical protein VMZ04_07815, partial [Anaerolineae bacterium]|nr:hypothetical protein [Anaerolineae bacterium]
TIRFYEWYPEAITVGYSQKILELLDFERYMNDRMMVTRRMTGGGAVLHKHEIAYAVIGSIDDIHFGGSIRETYRAINMVLCEGINKLGVHTVLSQVSEDVQKPFTGRLMFPCFSRISRFEILLSGKKIVGSAQRRFNNFFLQHGTILTGPGYKRITEYMKNKMLAEKCRSMLSEKSIDLLTVLGDSFKINELKISLKESCAKKCEGKLEEGFPTSWESTCAQRLINERYGSKGWVLNHGQ